MIHIALATDRRMIAGLHVSTYSILKNVSTKVYFHLFSSDLVEADISLLKDTLSSLNKVYDIKLYNINDKDFNDYPKTHNNSLAVYYRLLIPCFINIDRIIYIDVDTLCNLDLLKLFEIDMKDKIIAMAPEAPINTCIDQRVFKELGDKAQGYYFNSGVIVIDVVSWKKYGVTRRCMEYIAKQRPDRRDQSALNFVLHGEIYALDECFNFRVNARENWPALKAPNFGQQKLIHYLDFPKPWNSWGRQVHPLGHLWWDTFRNTAYAKHGLPAHGGYKTQWNVNNLKKYKKVLKDNILFKAYSMFNYQVKGLPQ